MASKNWRNLDDLTAEEIHAAATQGFTNPRARSIASSAANQAINRTMGREREAASQAQDQQREAERQAVAAQKEQARAAKEQQARNIREAQAAGVKTETDVYSGETVISRHPDGAPVWTPKEIGGPVEVGQSTSQIRRDPAKPESATTAPFRNPMIAPDDGAVGATGGVSQAIISQPIINDRGKPQLVDTPTTTDASTGLKYVTGTDPTTGQPTKTAVGIDQPKHDEIQWKKQYEAKTRELDMRDNAVKQTRSLFDPKWEPAKKAFDEAERELKTINKKPFRYEKGKDGVAKWTKIDPATNRPIAFDPAEAKVYSDTLNEAKAKRDRAKADYDRLSPTATNLERNEKEVADTKLKFTGEKLRRESGLPEDDGGTAEALAWMDYVTKNSLEGSQVTQNTFEDVVAHIEAGGQMMEDGSLTGGQYPEEEATPEPGAMPDDRPLIPDDPEKAALFADQFQGLVKPEEFTLGTGGQGYTFIKRNGEHVGKFITEVGQKSLKHPVLVLNDNLNQNADLRQIIAFGGTKGVDVYLGSRTRPDPFKEAQWTAGVFQSVRQAQEAQQTPEQMDKMLKEAGADQASLFRKVRKGEISVQRGEAIMRDLYGTTLKAEDPLAPGAMEKYMTEEAPADIRNRYALAKGNRDTAEMNAVGKEYINNWFLSERMKPGVTLASKMIAEKALVKELRGGEKAAGVGAAAGEMGASSVGMMAAILGVHNAEFLYDASTKDTDEAYDKLALKSELIGRGWENVNRGAVYNFKRWMTDEGKGLHDAYVDSGRKLQTQIALQDNYVDGVEDPKFQADFADHVEKTIDSAMQLHGMGQEEGWEITRQDLEKLNWMPAMAALSGDMDLLSQWKELLLEDHGTRQAKAMTEELTRGQNRYLAAFTAGSVAPPQEILLEAASYTVAFGVGKVIYGGAKTAQIAEKSARLGRSATRIQKLRAAALGMKEDYVKLGMRPDTLAAPASQLGKASNQVVKGVKVAAAGAVTNAPEEAAMAMTDRNATAHSVVHDFLAGGAFGAVMPILAAPFIAISNIREGNARKAAAAKYAEHYNKTNRDTEGFVALTPENAEVAMALVPPETRVKLNEDYKTSHETFIGAAELLAKYPKNTSAQNNFSRAQAGFMQAADAQAMAAARHTEAVKAIEATDPAQRDFASAVAKVASGRTDLLTTAERRAAAGAQTADGKPYFADVAGKEVVTDDGRADALDRFPEVAALIQTTESQALLEAQTAAENFTQPEDASGAQGDPATGGVVNRPHVSDAGGLGNQSPSPTRAERDAAIIGRATPEQAQSAGLADLLKNEELTSSENIPGLIGIRRDDGLGGRLGIIFDSEASAQPVLDQLAAKGFRNGKNSIGNGDVLVFAGDPSGGTTEIEKLLGLQPAAPDTAPADTHSPNPAGAPNLAELDSAEYESLRSENPEMPAAASVVLEAFRQARPVSVSMAKATGIRVPPGYTRQAGVWRPSAEQAAAGKADPYALPPAPQSPASGANPPQSAAKDNTPQSIAARIQASVETAIPGMKGRTNTVQRLVDPATGEVRPTGGAFANPDGTVSLSLDDIAREMQGRNPAAVEQSLLDIVLRHEIVHVVQYQAVQRIWVESGGKVDFPTFFREYYGRIASEVSPEAMATARGIYGAEAWDAQTPENQAAELVRMLVEAKLNPDQADRFTELSRQINFNESPTLIAHLKAAVDMLIQMVKTGKLPESARAHVEELAAMYEALVGQNDGQSNGQESAKSTQTQGKAADKSADTTTDETPMQSVGKAITRALAKYPAIGKDRASRDGLFDLTDDLMEVTAPMTPAERAAFIDSAFEEYAQGLKETAQEEAQSEEAEKSDEKRQKARNARMERESRIREKARTILNSGNYSALSSVFEKGRIQRKPNAIGLILARKRSGKKLTEREMGMLRNLSEWDGAPTKSEWKGGGNNEVIRAILDYLYAKPGEGLMPDQIADGLIPGVDTSSEMFEAIDRELRALSRGESLIDPRSPDYEGDAEAIAKADAAAQAAMEAEEAAQTPLPALPDIIASLEETYGENMDLAAKLKIAQQVIAQLPEPMQVSITQAAMEEEQRIAYGVISAAKWQEMNPGLSKAAAFFQRLLDNQNPATIRATINKLRSPERQKEFARLSLASSPSARAEMDSAYLAAVEAGDMETAQRMVDAAANIPEHTIEFRQTYGNLEVSVYGRDDITTPKVVALLTTLADSIRIDTVEAASDAKGQGYGKALYLAVARYAQENYKESITGSASTDALNVRNSLFPKTTVRTQDDLVFAESPVVGGVNYTPKSLVPSEDSDYNVIPLSQRFNPQSDSLLFSSPSSGFFDFGATGELGTKSQMGLNFDGPRAKAKTNAQAQFDKLPQESPGRARIAGEIARKEGLKDPAEFVKQATQPAFGFNDTTAGTRDQLGLFSSPSQRAFDFGTSGSFSTRNQGGFDFGDSKATPERTQTAPESPQSVEPQGKEKDIPKDTPAPKKTLAQLVDEALAGTEPTTESAKLRKEADRLTKQAMKMLDSIPPGQPVLSTADRTKRQRADDMMKKAAEYIRRAETEATGKDSLTVQPTTPRDTSHLNALELGLSNERERLRNAKTDKEKRQREVWVGQMEREVAGEREFLGLPPATESTAQSDEELLAALGSEGKTKQNVPAPGKITDFGEKIGGARKDYAQTFADAKALDIASEPFSKVWPEPDYAKLVEQGGDPWTVGFIRAMRDEVPTKPRQGRKLSRYVQQVNMLRDMAESILTGEYSKDTIQDLIKSGQYSALDEAITGAADLYAEVGHAQSLKGIRFAHQFYSLYRGEKNIWKWEVTKRAKATAFSNMPQTIAEGNTREEALERFKEVIGKRKEQGKPKVKFEIYRYTSKDAKPGFIIGKKIGRHHADLFTFETAKEAREYLMENYDDVAARLEAYKKIGQERRAENAPRVGADHRQGRDITPQMFQKAFSFRGVEFGNYVEQKRRQSDLNRAYEALMDLAAILNIPPQALSLDSTLGLAFGARGSGGKNASAAHYEPGKIAINLTKNNGPGSLAHEWFHAMDNYFLRQVGKPADFATSQKRSTWGGRMEVMEAFGNIIRTIDKSGLRKRSALMDKKRSSPYWSTDIELSARAFENYVIERLKAMQASNDYLANISDISEYAESMMEAFFDGNTAEDLYPYLTEEETAPVVEAFDNLFDKIQSKETDRGIALFSSPSPQQPQGQIEITQIRERFRKMPSDIQQRYNALEQRLGLKATAWLVNRLNKDAGYFPIISDIEANEDLAVRYAVNDKPDAPIITRLQSEIKKQEQIYGELTPSRMASAVQDAAWSLMGDKNAVARQDAMEALTGARPSKANSGVTQLANALTKWVEDTNQAKAIPGTKQSSAVQTTQPDLFTAATAPDAGKKLGDVKVGRMHALTAYRSLTAKRATGKPLTATEEQQLLDAEVALGQKLAFDMEEMKAEVIPQPPTAAPRKPARPQAEIDTGDSLFGSDNSFKVDREGQMRLFSSPASFYSPLERAVEAKIPARATPEQIMATVRAAGVKAEEIKWSGIEQALQSLAVDGKVPKDALLAYLRDEGSVRFEEVSSEGETEMKWKNDDGYSDELLTHDEMQEVLEKEAQSIRDSFDINDEVTPIDSDGDETTEGNEDYPPVKWRMNLTDGRNEDFDSKEEAEARMEEELDWIENEAARIDESSVSDWQGNTVVSFSEEAVTSEGTTKFSQYTLAGGENYREVVLAMPPADANSTVPSPSIIAKYQAEWDALNAQFPAAGVLWTPKEWRLAGLRDQLHEKMVAETNAGKPQNYTSSHFPDVPNYVAHMRVDERTLPDGKRTMHASEYQSDRHQDGRKKGYKTGDKFIHLDGSEFDTEVEAKSHVEQVGGRYYRSNKTGVAPAPFQTTWPLALFKRHLRDAVAGGFDAVSWDTGETQNDRFDLSKQVDAIRWSENANGTFNIGFSKDGNWHTGQNEAKANDLPDIVGKEVAQKIVAASENETSGELSGLDLKVGGKGMLGFYDNMLPKEIGKYVKQWGGTVTKSTVEGSGLSETLHVVTDPQGEIIASFANRDKAERFAAEEPGRFLKPKGTTPIWRIDITPAMREGVTGGQALFSSPSAFREVSEIARNLSKPPNQYEYTSRTETRSEVQSFLDAFGYEGYNPPADIARETDRSEQITGVSVAFVKGAPLLQLGGNNTLFPRVVTINVEYPHASIGYGIVHELVHAAQKDSRTKARKQIAEIASFMDEKEFTEIQSNLKKYGYSSDDMAVVASEFQAFLIADAVMGTNYIGLDNLSNADELRLMLKGFFESLPKLAPDNGPMELFSTGTSLASSPSRWPSNLYTYTYRKEAQRGDVKHIVRTYNERTGLKEDRVFDTLAEAQAEMRSLDEKATPATADDIAAMFQLASSPAPEDSAAVESALSSMRPFYRRVFESINSGMTPEQVMAKYSINEKAVVNIMGAVMSRIEVAKRASRDTLKPEMKDGKFVGNRPDLAEGAKPDFVAIDQIRNENEIPGAVTRDENYAEADRLLAGDYEGQIDRIIALHRNGKTPTAVDVAVAKTIIRRETLATGLADPERRARIAMLRMTYRDLGSDQSRAFSMRQDESMTPAERNAASLADLMMEPPADVRKRYNEAKDEATRKAIMKQWMDRLDTFKKQLLAEGIDIDKSLALFNGRIKARKQAEADNARTKEAMDGEIRKLSKIEKTVVESILDGAKMSAVQMATGIEKEEILRIHKSFDDGIRAAIAAAAKRFMSSSLGSSPTGDPVTAILADLGWQALDDFDDTAPDYERKQKEKNAKPAKPKKTKAEEMLGVGTKELTDKQKAAIERFVNAPPSTWVAIRQETAKLFPQSTGFPESYKEGENARRILSGMLMPEDINEATGTWDETRPFSGQGELIREPINETTGTFDMSDPVVVANIMNTFGRSGVGVSSKLIEWYKMAILSGIQTMLVNTAGGMHVGYLLGPQRALEAGWNGILGMFGAGDTRSATFGEFIPMFRNFRASMQLAARNAVRAWELENPVFESYAAAKAIQLDFDGKSTEFSPPPNLHMASLKQMAEDPSFRNMMGVVNRFMRNITFRELTAVDEFWKGMFSQLDVAALSHRIAAKEEKLEGDAYTKRVQELMQPGSLAWKRTMPRTKKATFQDLMAYGVFTPEDEKKNPAHRAGTQMTWKQASKKSETQSAFTALDALAAVALEARNLPFVGPLLHMFALPFINTPKNLIQRGLEITPIGLVVDIIDGMRSLKMRLHAGKLTKEESMMIAAELYNKTRFVQTLTNQTMAIMAYLAIESLVGEDDEDELGRPRLTGTVPFSNTKKGERENIQVVMPAQSIRIGNVIIPYGRLDPFSTAIATLADIAHATSRQGGYNAAAVTDVIVGMKDQFKEKLFFKGIGDIIKVMEDPTRGADRLAAGYIASMVPNIVRQPIREIDPVMRDRTPRAEAGMFEAIATRVGYNLVPQIAPEMLDIWGEPIRTHRGEYLGGSRALDAAFRIFDPTNTRFGNDAKPIEVWMYHYNYTQPDSSLRIGIEVYGDKVQVKIPGEPKPRFVPLTQEERAEAQRNIGRQAQAILGVDWDWRKATGPEAEMQAEYIKKTFSQLRAIETARLKTKKYGEIVNAEK